MHHNLSPISIEYSYFFIIIENSRIIIAIAVFSQYYKPKNSTSNTSNMLDIFKTVRTQYQGIFVNKKN